MLKPMLASLVDAPLTDPHLVYEPKYDGIRAIVEIGAPRDADGPAVRIWSRLGNDKTAQFPEIVAALRRWGRRLPTSVVLDGEIVALDARGNPTGFQNLQGRIHVAEEPAHPAGARSRGGGGTGPETALIAFDLLREGDADYRHRPLLDRRRELERLFGRTGTPLLRISDMVLADGRALYQQALDSGWEGLIAKDASSIYESGKRTPHWRKLKIVQEQEFVIGGWTEPRHTRSYLGALLLGVYEEGGSARQRTASPSLVYTGHTGTGFNERELARLMKLLRPLETTVCPFRERPRTNQRPHWVRPELVAQVKFTEWTADAKLRNPVYIGLRDDKRPLDIRREPQTRLHATTRDRLTVRGGGSPPRSGIDPAERLVDELRAIEETRRDGVLSLPDGSSLKVGNLHKIFWPKQGITKGGLMRYYVQVAPLILPAVADRPLVMKRYPDGIEGAPFYQHRIEKPPSGVRVEMVEVAQQRPQIVGGNLLTLLYMTQLAAISQDPWFSRVTSPDSPDYVALDLDPAEGVPFARVLDVARWIRDELEALGAAGVPKTSGVDGLHVYIALPPNTPYDAGLLFCQIVATVVAQKHPQVATIERTVRARGRRVYVDYLQNAPGKTLATAYSARASEYAGVSTPLTWSEIDRGVDREAFTIETVLPRLKRTGDLWAQLRQSRGVDLARVTRYAAQAAKGV